MSESDDVGDCERVAVDDDVRVDVDESERASDDVAVRVRVAVDDVDGLPEIVLVREGVAGALGDREIDVVGSFVLPPPPPGFERVVDGVGETVIDGVRVDDSAVIQRRVRE